MKIPLVNRMYWRDVLSSQDLKPGSGLLVRFFLASFRSRSSADLLNILTRLKSPPRKFNFLYILHYIIIISFFENKNT